MDTFGIEDLLGGSRNFVDRGPRCVRCVSITPGLDRLYFC
jgi:hypothetical protein